MSFAFAAKRGDAGSKKDLERGGISFSRLLIDGRGNETLGGNT
jgi:hypothetical protein